MGKKDAGHTSSKNAASIERPKESVIMAISSDSESHHRDFAPSEPGAVKTTPAVGEPSPKRQRLALRVRDGEATEAHEDVSLEIAGPPRRSVHDEIADSQDEGSEVEDEEDEEVFKTPSERKHVVFDDTENEEFVTPLEAPLKDPLDLRAAAARDQEEEGDADGSDDDAPPEAVSSHAAQVQSTKTEEAALKAVRGQKAEHKRKRQERDAFFKQQAMDRKPAKDAATEPEFAEPESDHASKEAPGVSRKRKADVPDILPPELLESDDDRDEESRQAGPALSARPKKIRFNTLERQLVRGARPPRDERVGSTIYRVVKSNGDTSIAPKMSRASLNMKEKLLARNRVTQRRGGFLRR